MSNELDVLNTPKNNTVNNDQGVYTPSYKADAKESANVLYQQKVEETKNEYSAKAAEINTTAKDNQEKVEMQNYSNKQTAEKLGWNSGYVLDQDRQLNVLKSGIQAQLYNEVEMQRLGIKSSLAAARLAADQHEVELAHQYYQEEVSNAINEANITGTYISAEVKDMIQQRDAAKQNMEMYDPESEEYKKALKVYNYINDTFKADTNLSEEGVKTLAYLQFIAEKDMQDKQYMLSLIAATKNDDAYKNGTSGIVNNSDGNAQLSEDGSTVKTIDYKTASADELKEALDTGTNNHILSQYADYKLNEIYTAYEAYLANNKEDMTEETWNKFVESTGKVLVDDYKQKAVGNATNDELKSLLNKSQIINKDTNFTLTGDLSVNAKTNETVAVDNLKNLKDKYNLELNSDGKSVKQISASLTKLDNKTSGWDDDVSITVGTKNYSCDIFYKPTDGSKIDGIYKRAQSALGYSSTDVDTLLAGLDALKITTNGTIVKAGGLLMIYTGTNGWALIEPNAWNPLASNEYDLQKVFK